MYFEGLCVIENSRSKVDSGYSIRKKKHNSSFKPRQFVFDGGVSHILQPIESFFLHYKKIERTKKQLHCRRENKTPDAQSRSGATLGPGGTAAPATSVVALDPRPSSSLALAIKCLS